MGHNEDIDWKGGVWHDGRKIEIYQYSRMWTKIELFIGSKVWHIVLCKVGH